jgi:pimeloyl-ACP methyl ester carboxylesterase
MLTAIDVPTLVIGGEQSSPFMRDAAAAVAATLPAGQLITLPGQSHGIDPDATAAVIGGFLDAN